MEITNRKIIFIFLIIFLTTIISGFFIFLNFKQDKENKILNDIVSIEPENEVLLKPEIVFIPETLTWKEETNQAEWQGRDSFGYTVFDNKIWLMGGLSAGQQVLQPGIVQYELAPHFNDVWNTEDGVSWQKISDNAPWGLRRSMQIVDFKGKMWLMGGWGPKIGYKNDIWSSVNGLDWKKEVEQANWPAREGHSLIVFDNKIWLIGGIKYDGHQLFNDVWSSEDGINWILVTENAQWSGRWDHAVTIFENKLWLTNGMDSGSRLYNDVWSSEDGKTWTEVVKNAPWKTRQGNNIFGYKNKLWIIGRLNIAIEGGENDVWFSENGIDWQKTNYDPKWTGREDFGAVIFKDKIWVFGGMDTNWKWKNDVWSSEITNF